MPVSIGAEVAPGKLSSVVTYLETTAPPRIIGEPPAPPGAAIERLETVPVSLYRDLYRRVGEAWLWWEQLQVPDDELAARLRDPAVEVFMFRRSGDVIGYAELDRREPNAVEIVFFGLVPEAIGQGLGRFFFARMQEIAWQSDPHRVWLHTCTEDHPRALGFYKAAGFRPYCRERVIIDDPRSTGLLPAGSAPHVPPVR
ncbi:MAG: GNAT family N-acetyltransferase [Rhodospirillales bacterium]|nr:GNAT family N-acetyltransferase [Rhodospirillales bacterium]